MDITGIWHGVSTYPGVDAEDHFSAELSATGGRITGMITEVSNLVPNAPMPLRAAVEGAVIGHAIDFEKTYDGGGGHSHVVRYSGILSVDGSEIAGNWQLPGLEGSFVLRRANDEHEEVRIRPTGVRR